MKFWDTSALASLLFDEPGTALARSWLADDPEMLLWARTRVELVSAIERR